MARKATLENLKRNAEGYNEKITDLLNQLDDTREKQAAAWDKYYEREKEIEQEKNNDLAAEVKSVFGEDITPAELKKELDELLLIDEFKEYIEHEKAERKAVAERKAAEEAAKKKAENKAAVADDNGAVDNKAVQNVSDNSIADGTSK